MNCPVARVAYWARPIRRDTLAPLVERPEFDFIEHFSSQVTAKVLFRMLRVPPGNDREVRDKAVLMVRSDPVTRRRGSGHIAAYEWMLDYAGRVLAERRANPREDLLS
jgi:hypothetical protein